MLASRLDCGYRCPRVEPVSSCRAPRGFGCVEAELAARRGPRSQRRHRVHGRNRGGRRGGGSGAGADPHRRNRRSGGRRGLHGPGRVRLGQYAEELTEHDAFTAHAETELGITPGELANPWHAAISSAVAFTVGALLPLIAILLPPVSWRIPITAAAVLTALIVTGAVSARLGGAPPRPAVIRNMVGGGLALIVTYAIGHLVGVAIG